MHAVIAEQKIEMAQASATLEVALVPSISLTSPNERALLDAQGPPLISQVWRDGKMIDSFALLPSTSYTIGRAADAAIPADHASCSRQHAVLRLDASGLAWVEDLGSTHGTRVDNCELEPRTPSTSTALQPLAVHAHSNPQPCAPHCAAALGNCSKVIFGQSGRSFLFKAAPGAPPPVPDLKPALSADEKRKLLWGGKRRTEGAASWDGAAAAGAVAGGGERQGRFLALTGAKRAKGDGGGSGAECDGDGVGGGGGGTGAVRIQQPPTRLEAEPEGGGGAASPSAAQAAQQGQHELFSTLERQFMSSRAGAHRSGF